LHLSEKTTTAAPAALSLPGNFSSTLIRTLQVEATNSSQSVHSADATSRPQTKDNSGGSHGNDANAKSDHTPNSAVSHTDGKEFAQSLDTPNASSGNQPAAATDLNIAAASARATLGAQSSSADAKPNASGGASLSPTQPGQPASIVNPLIVSGARLADHSGQTEIRVEMHAESLGGVQLHAHITGDQINASIAVEHHDAQILLTNELPALHSALVEKNLRVDSLSVSQGMGASTSGSPGDTGQRGFDQNYQKPVYFLQEEISLSAPDRPAEWADANGSTARLSVLA
jgi:flagellar hook-length control protein FliK